MSIYEPIRAVQVNDGKGLPTLRHLPEVSSLTVLAGTPVKFNSGYIDELADPAATTVVGITAEPGHNLTASGTAEDGYSEATPVNQASAKTIPVGAWVKPGNIAVYLADDRNIFSIMLLLGQTFSVTMRGVRYLMSKDATTGLWYIDNTDSGTATKNTAEVVDVDPSSPGSATLGERVFFKFPAACRAL